MNITTPIVLHLQGPSRAPAIIAGNLIPELVATIFFIARVYSRAWILRSWGPDDTFLGISWLGSAVMCICSCLSTKYGSGHHIWDVPAIPSQYIIPTLQIGYGSLIVYQVTIALTKVSVCLFYLRIFGDKTSRYLVYTTIGFICLYTVPTVIVSIFQCKPVEGYWNVTISSTCVNPTAAFYVNGIGNIFTDAWLIALVVPRLWYLKMARKQKIALFVIITLSWLVIIAAIVRMVRLGTLFKTKVTDTPWAYYDISIWTGLEASMGVFCVSAPGVKPVLKQIAPGFLQSYGYGDSKNPYAGSTRPNEGAASQSRRTQKWFKPRGAIELDDNPRSESFAKGSAGRSQSSGGFWKERDVENDATSSEGILPLQGVEEGKQGIVKQTIVTIQTTERKKS